MGFPFCFDILSKKGFIVKKINTESKTYKRIRGAISWTALTGGAGAVDCVMVPFIYAVFGDKKFRLFREICMVGCYGLSIAAGAVSKMTIDNTIDGLVDAWNEHVDDEPEQKKEEPSSEVPPVMACESINIYDQLIETKLFEFDSEDTAKAVCEHCVEWLNRHGKITVHDVDGIRWLEDKNYSCHIYTDGTLYGWSKIAGEIEQVKDNLWYLDFGIFDVVPNYYKSDEMNPEDLVKNDYVKAPVNNVVIVPKED